MTAAWMIDELAHAGDEHLDAAFVAGYDRKQGRPDPAPDIAELRARGLDATSVVVEFGAGTGQFAIPAARVFGRVVAVDVSPAMVGHLRGRATAGLTVVRAGFLSYEHTGPTADGVYTRHALHQLPDFWKALALHRIAGIAAPGRRAAAARPDLRLPARRRRRGVRPAGSRAPRRTRPPATPPATTPSTSAPSTARSGGCSSRCWRRPASRSCRSPTRAGCTAPTPASSGHSSVRWGVAGRGDGPAHRHGQQQHECRPRRTPAAT